MVLFSSTSTTTTYNASTYCEVATRRLLPRTRSLLIRRSSQLVDDDEETVILLDDMLEALENEQQDYEYLFEMEEYDQNQRHHDSPRPFREQEQDTRISTENVFTSLLVRSSISLDDEPSPSQSYQTTDATRVGSNSIRLSRNYSSAMATSSPLRTPLRDLSNILPPPQHY